MEMNATMVTVLLNIASDIYFRAKEIQPNLTPENLKDHITNLEAQIEAANKDLGID